MKEHRLATAYLKSVKMQQMLSNNAGGCKSYSWLSLSSYFAILEQKKKIILKKNNRLLCRIRSPAWNAMDRIRLQKEKSYPLLEFTASAQIAIQK